MNSITTVIDQLDWSDISTQLNQEGFAIIPGFLHSIDLLECIQLFNAGPDQRRLNLSGKLQGRGEVIYWPNELPDSLGALRSALYQPLARIANQWNATLEKPYRYPQDLAEFHAQCRNAGQQKELSNITRFGEQDYLGLQQQAEGEHVFPLQVVALLSSPSEDFTGGEYVLTEQRPRMQSRPMVVPLKPGDIALITTAQRPFKGSKGYYRVNLKHAISRVRSGERLGLELTFHLSP